MEEQQNGRIAIVDGSNVAHASEGEQPSLENIEVVLRKLEAEGYESFRPAGTPSA